MKALLCNDDGIDADGLAALAEAIGSFAEVVVVAPHKGWSGCGHQTTTGEPIAVEEVRPGWWRAYGTPADCVRLALLRLTPDVDWVFSGINHGGNLGVDVHMSGTVAAAREASLFGRPAIAFSHYIKQGKAVDWQLASTFARSAALALTREPLEQGYLNVNLPHREPGDPTPTLRLCSLAKEQFRFRLEDRERAFVIGTDYHARPRAPGSDVDVCFGGEISVTRLVI